MKRGYGGIREIEFIIQSMQLIHGGRNPPLRLQEGKQALDLLLQKGFIQADEVLNLSSAYAFWRRVEHAIQARRGEQTHALPEDYIDYLEESLAISDVGAEIRRHQSDVATIFSERVLPVADEHGVDAQGDSLSDLQPQALANLSDTDREKIEYSLQRIDAQLLRGLLPERSRKQVEIILGAAMPRWIDDANGVRAAMPRWIDDANGVRAVADFADLLCTIGGRAIWIDLLATHQGALA